MLLVLLFKLGEPTQFESKYMTIQDFEAELKLINKDLFIRPNNVSQRVLDMFPDVNKLASITYQGTEICTIPNYDIYDEPNGSYGIDLRQDGRFVKHRTRPEALQMVKQKLEELKNPEYADLFFGRGEYSDAALRSPVEQKGDVSLVEEVSSDIKEVGNV